jgi:hypothetical protein
MLRARVVRTDIRNLTMKVTRPPELHPATAAFVCGTWPATPVAARIARSRAGRGGSPAWTMASIEQTVEIDRRSSPTTETRALVSTRKSWRFAAVFVTLALGACASAAVGVTSLTEPTYVAMVEVIGHDDSIPPAFADSLREAILSEAAFYGTAGRPMRLRVDLDKVHFKNALMALTIGDDNQAKGRVTVLDATAQTQMGAFVVQVDAERSGISGGSIAMMVVGAVDPTGYVDIGTTVASAASADINRSGTALQMRANFAADTLRQTYGDARAKAVNSARQH